MREHWRKVVLFAFLIAFAWLVWPTPYRYHQLGPVTVRENRFTGKLERLHVIQVAQKDGSLKAEGTEWVP